MRSFPSAAGLLSSSVTLFQPGDAGLAVVRSWELGREVIAKGTDLSEAGQALQDEYFRIDSLGIVYVNDDTNSNWAADKALLKAMLWLPENDDLGEFWAPGSIDEDKTDTRGSDLYRGGDVEYCFAPVTPIALADGTHTAIEHIRIGDHVLAFDDGGQLHPARVTRLFRNVTEEWLELSRNGAALVHVTSGHQFLTPHGRFAAIEDIMDAGTGQVVDGDGSIVTARRLVRNAANAGLFDSAEIRETPTQGALALAPQVKHGWATYNFEVEHFHTYIAGGFRVHNDSLFYPQTEVGILADNIMDQVSAAVFADNSKDKLPMRLQLAALEPATRFGIDIAPVKRSAT